MMTAPKLRFKGFSDDWEQRKFGDLAQRQSETIVSNEDYPSVEYEDVISGAGVLNKDLRAKTSNKTGIKFSADDVLYGKLRPYLHNWLNPDFSGVAVGDWWVLKPVNMNKDFLYRLLQTSQFDDAANQSTGTKMPRADWKLVSNLEIAVPKSIEEQAKISHHISTLDNLITLHQRKCDALKELKKGMLQKMFPKEGAKIPEFRFKGFTGDWEQRKLGDISEIRTGPFGSVLHAEDYVSNGTPIVTTEHFKSGALPIAKEDLPQVSDSDYHRLSSYKLECGDIVFSRVGSVDINALVEQEQAGWLFSGRVLRVRPQMTVNGRYLHYLLETKSVKDDIISRAVGQTMPSINTEILNATGIKVAKSEDEQHKIGEYFANLDNLITLHQRKCDSLKDLKKGFLQKMFV